MGRAVDVCWVLVGVLCGALGAAARTAAAAAPPDESASESREGASAMRDGASLVHEAASEIPVEASAQRRGESAAQLDSDAWELRAGLLVGLFTPERDTGNVNLELVLPRFLQSNSVPTELLPRWRIGATGNLEGRTSYAYTGPLWTIQFVPRAFLDLYFGGLVHNGQLAPINPRLSALGCRVLYQAGGNFGYRLAARLSLMLSFDHGSSGKPLLSSCSYNEALDLVGLRLGYRF
jgi:lipid A 3-O-deacylase